MAYANEGNLETYLTIDIDNSISPQIETWSTGVDKYIDKYCGKSFAVATSEVRYFDGNGERKLDVDNFTSITSIEILETVSDDVRHSLTEGKAEDYITYPYNTSVKYQLILTPTSTVQLWPRGERRVKITADWGDVGVPEDIELAATMLLAGIVEKGIKGGSVRSESLGDYQVEYKDLDDISSVMGVKDILDLHRIYEL